MERWSGVYLLAIQKRAFHTVRCVRLGTRVYPCRLQPGRQTRQEMEVSPVTDQPPSSRHLLSSSSRPHSLICAAVPSVHSGKGVGWEKKGPKPFTSTRQVSQSNSSSRCKEISYNNKVPSSLDSTFFFFIEFIKKKLLMNNTTL